MNTTTIQQKVLRATFALCTVASLWGCKPELQGELGQPFNKVDGMIGVWELNSFSQTDLQSALTEVRDLSELYIDGMVTPMRITLNEDRSYAVSLEKGRNYFGDMGTWGLDDEEHPTFLILQTMDEMGMMTDTLQYNLGAVVRPHDSILDIVYDRPCDGDPVLAYTFSFTRQS